MDSLEALMDKLPDIYFDWYARLLPGGAFVLAVFFLSTPDEQKMALEHPMLLVAVSYLLGHFIQPASAFLVNNLKYDKKREAVYADYKKSKDKQKDLIRKVSKAHAEATSMMSAALLVLSVFMYFGFIEYAWSWFLAILALVLALFSWERVVARYRKIDDLK